MVQSINDGSLPLAGRGEGCVTEEEAFREAFSLLFLAAVLARVSRTFAVRAEIFGEEPDDCSGAGESGAPAVDVDG